MRNRDKDDTAPDTEIGDFDATGAGWDPYIFSILSGSKRKYSEERRREPRSLTSERRRTRLLTGEKDS